MAKRALAIAIDDNVPPAVALAAAKNALDRAGVSAKSTVAERRGSVRGGQGRDDPTGTAAAEHGQTTVKSHDS